MNTIGFVVVITVFGLVVLWWLCYAFFGETKTKPFVIYLAGTMSGNKNDGIIEQDYRAKITEVLKQRYPSVIIDDPYKDHPNSYSYDDKKAEECFGDFVNRASNADMIVAYIPEASMGTAIELWEAYHRGAYIVIISPLDMNWIVRICGHSYSRSLNDFLEGVCEGDLDSVIEEDEKYIKYDPDGENKYLI